MLDHQDITNVDSKGVAFTIRSVFIIDPKKTIRLILSYPASTGRNTAEVLRVLDSLQTVRHPPDQISRRDADADFPNRATRTASRPPSTGSREMT